MDKRIYAQDETAAEELLKSNGTYNADGELWTYTATYNNQIVVDMPFMGQGDSIDIEFLKKSGMKLVLVNPFHVKCSKELDDNIQTKTDQKGTFSN